MLKVAGWIISESAVDDWREARQELKRLHPAWAIRSRVVSILKERKHKGLKTLPFMEEHVIQTTWPKMTKEDRGKPVCLLVRRVNLNTKNETWNNFTPVPKKSPEDDDIFNTLGGDGLKLGEWITVPDPFEKDWPFAKRYPGARCPPEPACDSPYLERS